MPLDPGARFLPPLLVSRRPISHYLRALLCFAVWLCVSFAAEPAITPSPVDEPADDSLRQPPWFHELTRVVLTNSAQARERAEARLDEARRASDRPAQAWALLMISTTLRRQNDLPAAISQARAALAIAEESGPDLLRFNANYILGLGFNASGDYASAVDYFMRSLAYADARASVRTRSIAIAALGSAYERLGDLDRALKFKTEALTLAEQMGDRRAVGMYANNLAGLQETLGDRASARRNYERALNIVRDEGNRMDIADHEERLAMLDFADGKPESALATLERILPGRRTLRGRIKLTTTLVNLAEVNLKLGRLDKALGYAEEARGYCDAIESHNLRAMVYKRLAAVQEARGDHAAALAAVRREFAEREAMAGEAAQKRVAELQAQFDLAKKDQELARLSRQNEVQAAENRANEEQLARKAAELRVREIEVKSRNADLLIAKLDLERVQATRLALGAVLLAVAVALVAIVLFQRVRLKAERRVLAETQSARASAEEADRVKTRFLAIATHDIRTPVGNIAMVTESLRSATPAGSENREQLAIIGTEAHRVLGLVEDLLTVAAMETGKLELRLAPLDLGEVVTAAVDSLRWLAEAKRQTIAMPAFPAGGAVTEGDAPRLHQVVTNLISNAIKFSPPSSRIEVQLSRQDSTFTVSVRDQGPGLSAADINRLFAPFTRLAAQPGTGSTSHGLGLSIAHEIVRLHKGSIRVESQPGAGATFVVSLPAISAAA